MVVFARELIRPLVGEFRASQARAVFNDDYFRLFASLLLLFVHPMVFPFLRTFLLLLQESRGLQNENVLFSRSLLFRYQWLLVNRYVDFNDLVRIFTRASGGRNLFIIIRRLRWFFFQLLRVTKLVIRARRVIIRTCLLQDGRASRYGRRSTTCRPFVLFMEVDICFLSST